MRETAHKAHLGIAGQHFDVVLSVSSLNFEAAFELFVGAVVADEECCFSLKSPLVFPVLPS